MSGQGGKSPQSAPMNSNLFIPHVVAETEELTILS